MRAVVLFAHGSRDARWREPIEAIARRMAQRAPQVPVRCAYLELTEPDLPAAAAELVALGVTELRVVPVFLGMGRHVREDLPRLAQMLRERHAPLRITVADALGEAPEVTELLAEIALRPVD